MFDGELVRAARKRKGMSQEVLAAGCQLSVRTISNVESGRVPPSPETITAIASVLEARPEDFLIVGAPVAERDGDASKEVETIDPRRSPQLTPRCLDVTDRAYSVLRCGALITCLTCLSPALGPFGLLVGGLMTFVAIPITSRQWPSGSRTRVIMFGLGNGISAGAAIIVGWIQDYMAQSLAEMGNPTSIDLHRLEWAGTFATTGGLICLAGAVVMIAVGLFGRNVDGRRGPWCYAANWRAFAAKVRAFHRSPAGDEYFQHWSP